MIAARVGRCFQRGDKAPASTVTLDQSQEMCGETVDLEYGVPTTTSEDAALSDHDLTVFAVVRWSLTERPKGQPLFRGGGPRARPFLSLCPYGNHENQKNPNTHDFQRARPNVLFPKAPSSCIGRRGLLTCFTRTSGPPSHVRSATVALQR